MLHRGCVPTVGFLNSTRSSGRASLVPARRDFLAVLGARYSGIALSFVVSVLVTHWASQQVVGLFFWLIAVASFLAIPVSFGLNSNVHGLLATAESADPVSGSAVAVRGVVIALVIGTVALIPLLVLLAILPIPIEVLERTHNRWLVVLVIGLYSSSLAITLVQTEIYRYRNQHLRAGLCSGIFNNCLIVAGVAFAYGQYKEVSSDTVLVILAIAGVLGAVPGGLALYRHRAKEGGWSSGTAVIRTSLPATVTNICAYLVTQAQGVMGGIFLLPAQNALLGSTSRLSILIMTTSSVILQTPLAASVRAFAANDRLEAQRILARAARNAVFVVGPIALIMIFFGAPLLSAIFGKNYRDGANTLQVLAFAAVINAAKGSPGQMLLNTGFANVQMRLTIIGGLVALIAFLIGGLSHTPVGLAWAVLASVVIQSLMERQAAKKYLGLRLGFGFGLRLPSW